MKIKVPDRIIRVNLNDSQGQAKVSPRKVYILPTRYGVIFAQLLLLLLIGSINYGNNLAFFLTFLLAGLGITAIHHTWFNLVGLEITAGTVVPVFAGQTANFEIHLTNNRDKERACIQLQIPGHTIVSTDIDGKSKRSLRLQRDTRSRGMVPLGRFIASTTYPLGLLRAWSYVETDAACLVYPRPASKRPPATHSDYDRSSSGDKGVGVDDFVGIRTYRPGDSPKHINWKAVAGERGLQTKQFWGDRADRVWLDWQSMPGLDSEERLSRICRGILDACGKEQEFGLHIPGTKLNPNHGQQHRHRCLEALALYGEES